MLTERFLYFVKTEFQNFWQQSAHKPANAQEQTMFEQAYAYFMGTEQKKTTEQERAEAYHAYKRYRQATNPVAQALHVLESKYYSALEVAVGTNWEEIKLAYKAAMKKYHPDRFAHDTDKQALAQTLAQKINEAYQYFEKKFAKA